MEFYVDAQKRVLIRVMQSIKLVVIEMKGYLYKSTFCFHMFGNSFNFQFFAQNSLRNMNYLLFVENERCSIYALFYAFFRCFQLFYVQIYIDIL